MVVTFAVLNFDKSSEVRAEQAENIPLIAVTFSVLKFETSSEVRDEQL